MAKQCDGCRNGAEFGLPFSMAFQAIFDVTKNVVFAHEALVRGLNGEGAYSILSKVDQTNRYAFDQQCRVKAIELAAQLHLAESGASLSINFMPNAVYEPRACIRLTLETALRTGFPLSKIIFEFTENEELDAAHITNILRTYRAMGFRTAIDDFGAGHAGLSLLSKFQPDIVKIDMELIRRIDTDRVKRIVVQNVVRMLGDLGIVAICEGIETEDELKAVREIGVDLIQGYFLAKPTFEALTGSRVQETAAA